eukprot:GILJ01016613.1.p1 GENE.GILJ01016613.1~~GILJ01016613.1.p1  ORF type:complete len:152 (+),score=9.45 GILJ01016613.1:204-659(+)
MPRARYYCEYCDKTFLDTPAFRNKHVNGVHHQKLMKQWYDMFKDPAQVARENIDMTRPPCVELLQTGFCSRGFYCPFSHSQHVSSRFFDSDAPMPGPWTKARTEETEAQRQVEGLRDQLPPALQGFRLEELPPSLRPVATDSNAIEDIDWG